VEPVSVALITSILGGAASFLYELLQRRLSREEQETTEVRVERLTKSLRESLALISNIEAEIRERSKIAEKLQSDVEHYDRLAELRRPDVEAVAQVLRGELQQEGRKSFWKGVAVNFLFFVLGVITSVVVTLVAA